MNKEKVYENLFNALMDHAKEGVRITNHFDTYGTIVVLVGNEHYHFDHWKTKDRQARDLTNWLNSLHQSSSSSSSDSQG